MDVLGNFENLPKLTVQKKKVYTDF